MCVYDCSAVKQPVDVATVVALCSVLKRKNFQATNMGHRCNTQAKM